PCSANSRTAVSTTRRRVCSPRWAGSAGRTVASGSPAGVVITALTVSAAQRRGRAHHAPGQRAQPGTGEAYRQRPVPVQRPQADQPGGVAPVHSSGVGDHGHVAEQVKPWVPGRPRVHEVERYQLGAPGQPTLCGPAQWAPPVVQDREPAGSHPSRAGDPAADILRDEVHLLGTRAAELAEVTNVAELEFFAGI